MLIESRLGLFDKKSIDTAGRSSEDQAVLPKTFFKGKSVFIQISQKKLNEHIKINLTKAGAVVLSELVIFVDFILSDNPIQIIPAATRSRGSKLVKMTNAELYTPKNILLRQIPWVLEDDVTEKEEKNLVVVADALSRLRPNFLYMRAVPCIYYYDVPRGYTVTPLEKEPANINETMESIRRRASKPVEVPKGPPDNSYCEICGTLYCSAVQHRKSREHMIHKYTDVWDNFDKLAETINSSCFFK
jgi:hypothetical protein